MNGADSSQMDAEMSFEILLYDTLLFLQDDCIPEFPRFQTTVDDYFLSIVSHGNVCAIGDSLAFGKRLLELSSELELANDEKLRAALRADDERIAILLESIIISEPGKEAVLHLEDDSAQYFLDVVQDCLDKEQHHSLQRRDKENDPTRKIGLPPHQNLTMTSSHSNTDQQVTHPNLQLSIPDPLIPSASEQNHGLQCRDKENDRTCKIGRPPSQNLPMTSSHSNMGQQLAHPKLQLEQEHTDFSHSYHSNLDSFQFPAAQSTPSWSARDPGTHHVYVQQNFFQHYNFLAPGAHGDHMYDPVAYTLWPITLPSLSGSGVTTNGTISPSLQPQPSSYYSPPPPAAADLSETIWQRISESFIMNNELKADEMDSEMKKKSGAPRLYEACANCRRRKVKCFLPQNKTEPCMRCLKKGLNCIVITAISAKVGGGATDARGATQAEERAPACEPTPELHRDPLLPPTSSSSDNELTSPVLSPPSSAPSLSLAIKLH
ncbi:Kinase-like protein [Mycena sanguinolenta]|uniref:Kinase-like protein n=1 Tax=Mycena sanguinolenta TaxID=230812 RepID=A0A8H6Z6F0_9AGAR|nr:Kinase-like protein [Mycena sanguinolenta]